MAVYHFYYLTNTEQNPLSNLVGNQILFTTKIYQLVFSFLRTILIFAYDLKIIHGMTIMALSIVLGRKRKRKKHFFTSMPIQIKNIYRIISHEANASFLPNENADFFNSLLNSVIHAMQEYCNVAQSFYHKLSFWRSINQ